MSDASSDPARPAASEDLDAVILGEVQLLLAEKRTAMSVMRTGIAIFALPLSVLSLLIATSRYYDALKVLHLLVPLGVLNLALVALGAYLILHSLHRIRHYDQLIAGFKRKHSKLAELVD